LAVHKLDKIIISTTDTPKTIRDDALTDTALLAMNVTHYKSMREEKEVTDVISKMMDHIYVFL